MRHPKAFLSSLSCIAVAALGAVLPACSSSSSDDDTASTARESLLGAPVDPNHTFDVGICSGPLSGGDSGTCTSKRCSGTLVAPNVVLTAQHCVYQLDYAANWCDSTFNDSMLTTAPVRVTTSDSTELGSPKWYGVDQIHVPAKNLCHDDIALLVLHDSVPLNEAFPVRMSLGRDVAVNPPAQVAIVGRGSIAESIDLNTGAQTIDDGNLLRRILEHIPFQCATDTGVGCDVVDYSSPPTNVFTSPASYFVIGGSIASGDSGSGVFDQKFFHTPARSVIGVSAAGTWGEDGQPNHGLITRLDIHRDFILKTMVKAALASRRPVNPFSDDTGG